MRLEFRDLSGEITALDKLIEAQSELVEDLKQDLSNGTQSLSTEMVQLRELSDQIIVLRHLRQTRFEMEADIHRFNRFEGYGPGTNQEYVAGD